MKTSLLRTLIFVSLFLISAQKTNAQNWVYIPDTAFRAFLNTNYTSCMDTSGRYIDSTCQNVLSAQTLNLNNKSINDLEGVVAFKNLKNLYCNNNFLTGLPKLPLILRILNVDNNQITRINSLPPILEFFSCKSNRIDTIQYLPNTIKSFDCSFNYLVTLPTLPANLQNLVCRNNRLVFLPNIPNTLSTLICISNNLTRLPQLSTSLSILECDYNLINSLPSLPSLLTRLSCSFNNLSALPSLPNQISKINCQKNIITYLPSLPLNLKSLNCSDNLIQNLPSLPTGLIELVCGYNLLDSLPQLPIGLQELYCNNNLLDSLPQLSINIEILFCSFNNLIHLPLLPQKLKYLYAHNNMLSSLPSLSDSLIYLYLEYNQLNQLPFLPNKLEYLSCYSNNLSNLPTLPTSLTNLHSGYNNISCFPNFPNSIVSISIKPNPFDCLPNYIPIMDISLLIHPLCRFGNMNGCQSSTGIKGYKYKDQNINCVIDSSDNLTSSISVKLLDNASSFYAQTSSAINGVYHFPNIDTGNYFLLVDTVNKPYTVVCASPGNPIAIHFNPVDTLIDSINFAIRCKQGVDVGVTSVVPQGIVFPGQIHSLNISAGDMSDFYGLNCANNISGQVSVNISGPVTYNGVPSGALMPSVSGNTFTYSIADFGAVNFFSDFRLNFSTDTTAQAGDMVCVTVVISADTVGDYNPSNDTLTFCYNVINSYDPNRKDVYPMGVAPGYNEWLNYTVYFQNTGNAPAFNIKLIDTLSALLNPETFELLGFSHDVTYELRNNLLTFFFKEIMLPDSLRDPDGSIGYVQFRIKPKNAFTASTVITNQVGIYFDFNPPIFTNVASTAILTGIEKNAEMGYAVYPNPASDMLNIVFDKAPSQKVSLRMIDIHGKEVLSKESLSSSQISMPISDVANGFYILQIKIASGAVYNTRVVVNR